MSILGVKEAAAKEKALAACVKNVINVSNLASVDTQDRVAWRTGVQRSHLLPTPVTGNPAGVEK